MATFSFKSFVSFRSKNDSGRCDSKGRNSF